MGGPKVPGTPLRITGAKALYLDIIVYYNLVPYYEPPLGTRGFGPFRLLDILTCYMLYLMLFVFYFYFYMILTILYILLIFYLVYPLSL
jgi:hypothetical protein